MTEQATQEAPKLSIPERARRYYQMVLNRMAKPGTGGDVAKKLEVSEATVSRAKEDLERGCGVIAALGLKVVDESMVCIDRSEATHLRRLRRKVEDLVPWLLDVEVE